jgi:hypothetical protein
MARKDRVRPGQRRSLGRRAGVSAIALLGFVPALDRPGLAGQLLRHLHPPISPAAEVKPVASRRIAILDPALLRQLGAVGMVLEGTQAFLISASAGARIPAPDGHYRLSDGSVVTVQDGRVLREIQIGSEKNTDLRIAEWRQQWMRWNETWGQHEFELEELLGQLRPSSDATVARTVREVFTRIVES